MVSSAFTGTQTLHLVPTFCSSSPFCAAPSTQRDLTLHRAQRAGKLHDIHSSLVDPHQSATQHIRCIHCGCPPANRTRHTQTFRTKYSSRRNSREWFTLTPQHCDIVTYSLHYILPRTSADVTSSFCVSTSKCTPLNSTSSLKSMAEDLSAADSAGAAW